jgi:ATP-dependent Zn protease
MKVITMTEVTQRRLTAYHEVGHAIVAWWLGHPPKRVTIEPGDGYHGRTRHMNPFRRMPRDISPGMDKPESAEGVRMMRRIDHAIIITLAGPLAAT